jgi:hypothetical protein
MKKDFLISLLLILFISCSMKVNDIRDRNYIETQTSFFNLAHGDWLTNNWIRQPDNLKMVHETFKKIGYKNLLSESFLYENEFLIRDIYIKRNFYNLFDSLEITYSLEEIESKYYNEFWERRRIERNDSIVFEIVKDINLIYNHEIISYNPSFVNDTLFGILDIQFRSDSLTDNLAHKDFETLKQYGFHQSAYNLLYERAGYYDIEWNRDSLLSNLEKSTEYIGAWIEDNTK